MDDDSVERIEDWAPARRSLCRVGGVSAEGLGALCGAIFRSDQSGECAGSLVLMCRC